MSRPIVRIATAGITVGMVLMIVSFAVVRGFQREVRSKVIGFGSHFQVSQLGDGRSLESSRLLFEDNVYQQLKEVEGVQHVQTFAIKPGILETASGLQGVVAKGVGNDFDWTYLSSVLVEGEILKPDSTGIKPMEIIISSYIANRLQTELGEKVSLYFINSESDARQQNFTISGIYRTDLEDFDNQFVFTDLSFIQKYAGWGIDAQILSDTACLEGAIAIGALGFGGEGELRFEWPGSEWDDQGPYYVSPDRDTSFTVIVSDEASTTPDTATLVINFLDDHSILPCRPFTSVIREGVPSEQSYIGGYEILMSDYDQLIAANENIQRAIPFYLNAAKITDRNPDIFAWLEMLDMNVYIIIILMIIISIINMTSALLIIILERQSMIGTLKAFGIRDRTVMNIFLINSTWIIGKGLFWGNVIGIGLILIQHFTGLVSLNPVNYYVDQVPVWISLSAILLLNAGTMLICVLALLIPALYITAITPIKSIRFS